MLMPQAMEKKETMEGSAFMRGEASKAHYSTSLTLARALQSWPEQRKRRRSAFVPIKPCLNQPCLSLPSQTLPNLTKTA
jgi:hypothetical protein